MIFFITQDSSTDETTIGSRPVTKNFDFQLE